MVFGTCNRSLNTLYNMPDSNRFRFHRIVSSPRSTTHKLNTHNFAMKSFSMFVHVLVCALCQATNLCSDIWVWSWPAHNVWFFSFSRKWTFLWKTFYSYPNTVKRLRRTSIHGSTEFWRYSKDSNEQYKNYTEMFDHKIVCQ